MKRLFIALSFICTIHLAVEGQYYIGALVSPAMSTFQYSQRHASEFYIFPVNYGVTLDYKYKKFNFSTGLLHVTQGHGYEVKYANPQFPEGTGDFFDFIIRVKALMISPEVHYDLFTRPNSHFFIGAGINAGMIYSQQVENTSLPLDFSESTSPNLIVAPLSTTERISDIDIFDKNYFGLSFGIGWRHQISNRFHLQLHPTMLYQIRKNEPSSQSVITHRMMTFSLNLGFYYKLI